MSNVRVFVFWMGVIALGLGGCAAYVNIPPQAGDFAGHDINKQGVRAVCIEALNATIADHPIDGRYILVLPQGADPLTYETVNMALGDQVSDTADQIGPTLELRQIRIRADRAEVDIIRPADPSNYQGPGQLVTVYLKRDPLGGWHAKRLHAWRASVEQTLPTHTPTESTPVAP